MKEKIIVCLILPAVYAILIAICLAGLVGIILRLIIKEIWLWCMNLFPTLR